LTYCNKLSNQIAIITIYVCQCAKIFVEHQLPETMMT
jgi:hypothetical protein